MAPEATPLAERRYCPGTDPLSVALQICRLFLLPAAVVVEGKLSLPRLAYGLLLLAGLAATHPASVAQDLILPVDAALEGPEPEEVDLHSLYFSAHLPTDRRLSQDLEHAERLLREGRYSEGLPLVDQVIAAEEDAIELSQVRRATPSATSVKSAAKRLLAGLPAAGIAAYELESGVTARRRLEQAVQSADLSAIAGVAARYPLTEAGTDAMLIVALSRSDAGDYLAAARVYEELLTWPVAVDAYGPLLAAQAAVCWAEGGEPVLLEQALSRLAAMNSPAEREQLRRFMGDLTSQQWTSLLRRRAERPQAAQHAAGWLLEGGDPARNPFCTGGLPHVWTAWQARTIKESNVASQLQARVDWQQQHGQPWLLVSSPLAVGNLVIARTPYNVIAVDWQSGKRVWETRPETDKGERNDVLNINERYGNVNTGISLNQTEQRIWIDSIYGSLASDGARVYAIRNLDSLRAAEATRWGMPLFGGRSAMQQDPGNALAAYDLHSEGKLVWEINGAASESELAGVFFLGPPLAVGDMLYVMAELRNSIHLLAIEQASGRVTWKQPLANLERGVAFDLGRRLAGASPSHAHGLLICPTGAGSVVAVDTLDRSLAWIYRFPVDEEDAERGATGWHPTLGAYQPGLTSRWTRNRCLVASGRVLITSPESSDLHCLDLSTGQPLWTAPREEAQYIAGVASGKVLVVASREIKALDLATGKHSWRGESLVLPDDLLVTGLGIIADNDLLLPLSDGRLGVVATPTGELTKVLRIRDSQSIGNLAYHRGSIVTQSTTGLARFDQLAGLQLAVARGLAESPPTARALRIQGEIAWGEGNLNEAIEFFQQAYEANADSALVQLRLRDALLAGLQADYARYRDHADQLAELVQDTLERLALLRIHVDGSIAAGDYQAAFNYAVALYQEGNDQLLEIAPGHLVQSERWFAARLDTIWAAADGPLRNEVREEVDQLYQQARSDPRPAVLSRLVRYFAGIAAGRRARIELARELVATDRLSEAELLLLRPDPAERELQFDDLGSESRHLFRQLCGHEQRPATAHPADCVCGGDVSLDDWPDGKVVVDTHRVSSASQAQSSSSSRRQSRGPQRLLLESRFAGLPWSGPVALTLSDGGSHILGWNAFGEITQRIPLELPSLERIRSLEEVQTIRFGHFCVLGTGHEVVALDLRAQSNERMGPLMWESRREDSDADQTFPTWQQRNGFVQVTVDSDQAGPHSRYGQLCAATPQGVVIRKQDHIRCFDPVDGDLLWSRRNLPAEGEVFGDWRRLYLIEEGSDQGLIVSMIDGRTLGSWQRPAGKWITTVGGNIFVTATSGSNPHLRIVEAATGEELLRRDCSRRIVLAPLSLGRLLVAESSGRVALLDVGKATLSFEQQFAPEPQLQSVYVVEANETLFVAVNTRSAAQHQSSGSRAVENAPVVTGQVYALDAATGELRWDRPAVVEGQGLALLQPPASPVLLFVSEWQDRESNRRTERARVLCLDKRNGRSLAREERLRAPDRRPMAMRIDQGSQPTVTVDLRHTQVVLRFTDLPRPPEPVATFDVETGQKISSGGLFGALGNILGGVTEPALEIDDDD